VSCTSNMLAIHGRVGEERANGFSEVEKEGRVEGDQPLPRKLESWDLRHASTDDNGYYRKWFWRAVNTYRARIPTRAGDQCQFSPPAPGFTLVNIIMPLDIPALPGSVCLLALLDREGGAKPAPIPSLSTHSMTATLCPSVHGIEIN
jgi:hypothetical protein